eukprot:1161615-Pelagomonas_calceolata.AAC.10
MLPSMFFFVHAAAERWAKLKEKEEGTFGARVYKVSPPVKSTRLLPAMLKRYWSPIKARCQGPPAAHMKPDQAHARWQPPFLCNSCINT